MYVLLAVLVAARLVPLVHDVRLSISAVVSVRKKVKLLRKKVFWEVFLEVGAFFLLAQGLSLGGKKFLLFE